MLPAKKGENAVKVPSEAKGGRDGVNCLNRTTDATVSEAMPTPRKLTSLTVTWKTNSKVIDSKLQVRGGIPEFLCVILPFSETATDPTTTKSTRTLESKPTGVL